MNGRQLVLSLAALATAAQVGCGSGHETTGSATKPPPSGRITSSIADGSELAAPVRWQAHVIGVPPSDVASVRFLIDGNVRHVERKTPYVFAGLGNRLLPGTLEPGSHTFAVDAELADGRRLTAASSATVATGAPGVPRQVLGRWRRTVTPAQVRRTQSFRLAASGEALPTGAWKLQIGPDGVARYTDPTPAHDVTAGQVRFEPRGRLVVGNEIPNFPHVSEGGFCPDSVGIGSYRWSLRDGALVVRVVRDRECADRNSFWNATFTR